MATPSVFRRVWPAVLPVALLLAACSKEDQPAAPGPDRGRVLISHSAAAANTPITAFLADQQVAQLNYGQAGTYVNINAGTPALRINSGTQVVLNQPITVAKDQSYTVFAYSPAGTIGSVGLLTVPDDLTAPAAGQAKVRVVHLAVGAPAPVRLTVPSAIPGTIGSDLSPDVAFAAASGFFALNAGPINLSVTTTGAPRTQLLAVGDGTGAGAGTKNYESGKIYSVVVRGISGSAVPAAQQPQAVIIQHN